VNTFLQLVIGLVIVLAMASSGRAQTSVDSSLGEIQNRYPAWAPDGSRMAFQSDRTGSIQIWTMSAAGSDLIQLTHSEGDNQTPAWSPDGSRIVFTSTRDGDEELYRMNADGSEQRRLTRHVGVDMHPVWSSDGQRILFNRAWCAALFDFDGCVEAGELPGSDVISMRSDGTDLRRLTQDSLVNSFASFSPDGRRILFRRLLRDSSGRVNSEIFVMDADGSGKVNLSSNPAFEAYPTWSPDGTQILFSSNRTGSFDVYLMDADGTNLRRLTTDAVHDELRPNWSPDGSAIAYNRAYENRTEILVLHLNRMPLFTPLDLGSVTGDGGLSRGVAWGDFDADGFPDLVVGNTINQNDFLYRGRGDGSFESVVEGWPVRSAGWTEGVSWVDYDNDGDLDLFVARTSAEPHPSHPTRRAEPNSLYRNEGDGTLVPVEAGALTSDSTSSSAACWADADLDGDLDAYVVNRDGEADRIYENSGDHTFRLVPNQNLADVELEGRACAWGDADGDGDPDVYVGNFARDDNLYLRNEGGLQFTRITEGAFVNSGGRTYGVSWIDYDDDGDLDLFETNISVSDRNRLWENDGRGRFRLRSDLAVVSSSRGPSKGHTWGDFDNDGDVDLLVTNGTEGTDEIEDFDVSNFLYLNQGDGTFEVVTSGPIVTDLHISAGAGWADYDRDGDLDVFVANWARGDENNDLYRNTTSERTNRNWIVLRLEGRESNRMGIGARVRTTATIRGTSKTQTRWMLPATGYASQNEPVIHFGLDDAARLESLQIEWPSGTVDIHRDVNANHRWVVEEGHGLRLPDAGSAAF